MFGGLFSTTKKSCSGGGRKSRRAGTKRRHAGTKRRHAGTKRSHRGRGHCSGGRKSRHAGTKRSHRGRGHCSGGRKTRRYKGGMCGCENKKGGRGRSPVHTISKVMGKSYGLISRAARSASRRA